MTRSNRHERARPMPRFCRENRRLQGARALAFLQSLRVEEGCRLPGGGGKVRVGEGFSAHMFALAAMAFCAATAQAAPASDTAAPAPDTVSAKAGQGCRSRNANPNSPSTRATNRQSPQLRLINPATRIRPTRPTSLESRRSPRRKLPPASFRRARRSPPTRHARQTPCTNPKRRPKPQAAQGRAWRNAACASGAAGHRNLVDSSVRRDRPRRGGRSADRAAIHAVDYTAPPVDRGGAASSTGTAWADLRHGDELYHLTARPVRHQASARACA